MSAAIPDAAKSLAAERALALVQDDMRLGLGTGSTAAYFVAALGRRVAEGLKVVGVPTSEATRRQAAELGIALTTLDDCPRLDLTIDGADEIDRHLRAIKGGGGALLREKIVAAASARMVVIADASKRVERLGAFPLPIEIVRFGVEATRNALTRALDREGYATTLKVRTAADGTAFVTDEGHYILDAPLVSISDPERLAGAIAAVPGVVEHGLFIGLVTAAIIGANTGTTEIGPL